MIYLDHAAATPVDPKVAKAMAPYNSIKFGNPSALYQLGRQSRQAIEDSRHQVASILGCSPEEVIFTAGGTESDNIAIFGVMNQFLSDPSKYHCITSNIEHPAVLKSFKRLEQLGFDLTYIPVDKYGLIQPDEVMKALKPNTVLISLIYANNEIGTIQPISEISHIIKNYRHIQQLDTLSKNPIYPILHTDACQAASYLDIKVNNLGVDMMTLNGSKIYGPKQSGILYKNKNINLSPMLYGGMQENGIRPGTENTGAIVGFSSALKLAVKNKNKQNQRLEKLRHYLTMELIKIPDTILNGHPEKRLPNNANISFLGVEGESIVLKLDAKDIYVSTGSACHSSSLEPSHVILALEPKNFERAHSSIRFSLGRSTTRQQIDRLLKILPKILKDLRQISAIHHGNT